jgi:phosphatidylserine/phosphatidylglycerophosphate/cardiolipin synthase-like enzyme
MSLPRFALAVLFALAPASVATAQIDVYFTRPVDTTLASSPANHARHESDVSDVVARHILAARSTVDMAMYNLNVQRIADALLAVHRRGVRVRIVANVESVASPASRFAQLATAGVPVTSNPRGPSGQPQPLMHNKFIVIDGRPGASGDSAPTIITGSWNATVAQTFEDANNVVVIRDSAVAGAYRAEFEEMWGGSGDAPSPSTARFGAAKRDNTGHTFTLSDGTRVDVWFSPSDGVESRIRDAISTAQSSLYVASLTITSGVLASQMSLQKNRFGADVRALVENVDDQGSQYGFLSGAVDAHSTAALPAQLHHKYAVVDAVPIGRGSVPLVVTGSHNWTYSANSINDENTLVIYSAAIANQYLQEFAARYREAGGTRSFGTASAPRESATAWTIGPNPFATSLTLSHAPGCDVDVIVHDALGRVVARATLAAGDRRIAVEGAASGLHVVTLRDCRGEITSHPLLRLP